MDITFGKRDQTNFIKLSVKILSLLIPGILLGHYLDQGINRLKQQQLLPNLFWYIALQTLIMIVIFYILIMYSKNFTLEFQSTYAGLFFVAFFFGIQSNYISNVQELLGKW